MTSHHTPKHRRDVVDMPALVELDHLSRDHDISVSRSGPFQHVHTAHRRTSEHDAQVLMALSPAAANTLGLVLARFASMYGRPMLGLEDYDPSMWQDVALDLLRHKAHAGHLPEPTRVLEEAIVAGAERGLDGAGLRHLAAVGRHARDAQ